MTIDLRQRHGRAHTPPADEPGRPRRGPLFTGIVVFGGTALVGALVLVGLDIAGPASHLAVYAAACFVLAGLAATLLCLSAMLADRQEFYRRGQLEGWRRGWNGQPPELDDPLIR